MTSQLSASKKALLLCINFKYGSQSQTHDCCTGWHYESTNLTAVSFFTLSWTEWVKSHHLYLTHTIYSGRPAVKQTMMYLNSWCFIWLMFKCKTVNLTAVEMKMQQNLYFILYIFCTRVCLVVWYIYFSFLLNDNSTQHLCLIHAHSI